MLGRREREEKKETYSELHCPPSICRPAVEFQAALQSRPPLLAFIPSRDTTAIKIHQWDAVATLPVCQIHAPLGADWPKMESNNNQRVQ